MISVICNLFTSLPMFIILLVLTTNCVQTLGKGIEMFSLDKLVEYNTLIDCFTTIKDDFSACNREAHKRGEFVLKYIDEGSEFGVLLKCCGTWIVRDCWMKAAEDKCASAAKTQLHNLPAKFMPAITNVCKDYQPGSFYCYVPHIIGISVFVLALLIIGVAAAFAVIIYRRHNKIKRVEVESEHSNNNEDKLNDV